VTTIHPAIDCGVHPAAPGMPALLPYLDEYWRSFPARLENNYVVVEA
jgi:hypothetical protein